MAMSYANGAFTWGSGDSVSTTYTVSGLSFQPKLIMFMCMGLNGAGSNAVSQTTHYIRSVGFAGGTANKVCVGTFSEDNAAAANCSTCVADDCVVVVTDGSATRTGLLDLDSITSDGFVAINDDAPPQSMTVMWFAWGGSDISDVYCGSFSSASVTGTQSITGLTNLTAAATDQCLFLLGKQGNSGTNTPVANDSGFSFGISTSPGSSSTEQVMVFGNSDDASATMDTDGAGRTGIVVGLCGVGGATTLNGYAYHESWDSGGFSLNWVAASARKMGYCVVKGGNWKAGATTINTTSVSNTASVSGLSFTPAGLLAMSIHAAETTTNSTIAEDKMSIGGAASTSSRQAMGGWDENATANAEIDLIERYDAVLAFPTNAGAVDLLIDVSAFASDGFTFIVDDAAGTPVSAAWLGYLTFGSASTDIAASIGGGAVAIAGQAVTGAENVPLTAGSVTLAGQAVTHTLNAPITGGAVAIAGQSVTATLGAPIGGGAVTIAGESVTSAIGTNIALDAGAVTIAGESVTAAINAPLDAGALTVAGQTVTTTVDILIGDGAITIAGQDISASGVSPVAPAATGPTPAGSRRKRRYFVEIDGQQFLVDSPAEARDLLSRAYSLAERAASDDAERVVAAALPRIRSLGKVEPVKLAPKIATNVQTAEVQRIKAEIDRIYAEASRVAELRLLMAVQELQDDDDEAEDLLLMGML